MVYDLDGGLGLSALSHVGRRELYYAFAEADFGAAPVFRDGWRAGGGGTAGLMADLTRWWRAQCEATYIAYARSPDRERLRLVNAFHLNRDAELRLIFDRLVPDKEAGLYFYLYF